MELDYFFPLIGVLASLLWAYVSFRYYLYYSGLDYTGVGDQDTYRRLIRMAQVSMLVASLAFAGSLVYLFNLSKAPRPIPAMVTTAPGDGSGELTPTPSLVAPVVPTPPVESSPTPEMAAGTGFARIGNTTGFGVNVRFEPGLAAAAITQLSDGVRVELTGEVQTADGFTWQGVRLEDGRLGWIVDTFLIPEP
jgi:hypothetical protein